MGSEAEGRARADAARTAPGPALRRDVEICAGAGAVFAYFTDPTRWAAWWGEGSSIDPVAGGSVVIRYPGGVEVHGQVVEITPPERLVFTYGYASGDPIPPGASTVTIELSPSPRGTRVTLTHVFGDTAVRDAHVAGWRFQLSLFANVVFDGETAADAESTVDAWYAAWRSADAPGLEAITTDDVVFRDRFACLRGRDELAAHIAAIHAHGHGGPIERVGDVSRNQGLVLARRADGETVFTLAPDGRIAAAAGF